MIHFTATIQQFAEQGEKSGWTYVAIPAATAQQIKPDNKKTFRVKGKLDAFAISQVALMPMGGGSFILPLNATIRKGLKKRVGAVLKVQLEADDSTVAPPAELMVCLDDEPQAKSYYDSLTYGHRNYFTKWIESAKTESTRVKRVAQAIDALSKQMDFGTMLRSLKADRQKMV